MKSSPKPQKRVNFGALLVGRVMASLPTSVDVVRFGEYEANLRSRELRCEGASVRLPAQSFAVLAMLLEHPGELVTREEIHKRLWTADTFVDFDHGLNNAVNSVSPGQT
jgi:DNA-binding response OmpR family regulator